MCLRVEGTLDVALGLLPCTLNVALSLVHGTLGITLCVLAVPLDVGVVITNGFVDEDAGSNSCDCNGSLQQQCLCQKRVAVVVVKAAGSRPGTS